MVADLWEVPAADDGFDVPDDITTHRIDPGQYFKRFDMAQLARDGVPPAALLCNDLLYEGGLHSIAGPPDCGKSTFICWTGLQVIRDGGDFILMDEESGPHQYAEKFVDLGATPDELEHLYYYGFPGVAWNLPEVLGLVNLVEDIKPKVIAWDSSAAFLARAGLDEDRAPDVTRFWSTVLTPCARDHGAAVLVADHDTKSGAASRFARGSGAKLAAVDVQYKIEIITPFSRDQAGSMKLHVSKDRRGWLHRYHQIEVTPKLLTGDLMKFEVTSMDAVDALAAGLTNLQQMVFDVLSQQHQTINWVIDTVSKKTGQQHHRQVIQKILWQLSDMRLADKLDMGPGAPAYWARA